MCVACKRAVFLHRHRGLKCTSSASLPSEPSQSLHMNVLKRSLRDVDANLRRVNQELRSAKRRASESGKFRLREPQRTTGRILVAMHHGEPTAAMDYIQSKRKGNGLDRTCATQAEAELREWWRRADDATKQSHRVMEEASIKMQNAFKQAQRFTVEADLEAWVEDQNVQKGINPAPSLLLRQASMLKTSRGVSLPPTRRGERRWMQRWRSRRGLQLRKFPAQERLSVEQMQRKVHHRVDGYEHTCSRFAAPLMRYPAKKEGPFSVGFWCPRIGTEQKMWPENNRFFGIQSQSFVNICPPDGVQGECIVAMEQLPAKPRRTRPPPSAHQHG